MPPSKKTPAADPVQAYEKALKLMHQHKYEKAAELFSRLGEKPGVEDRIASRARSHWKTCQREIRSAAKQKVATQDLYALGVFQHNLGDYEQALDLFQEALKHSEQKDHIYLAMAAGEALRGEVEEALKHLKKSIEIDSVNRIRVLRDPDFECLAGNSEYKKLLRPT